MAVGLRARLGLPVGRFGVTKLKPHYYGSMNPAHPCREMPTRHCPAVYWSVCGPRPCARFDSRDETPWLPELFPPGEVEP